MNYLTELLKIDISIKLMFRDLWLFPLFLFIPSQRIFNKKGVALKIGSAASSRSQGKLK
jgi:hypothetical protein